jgi:APA family basic amino acid/polyamine antiporter
MLPTMDANLKRTIGLPALVGIEIGQSIGAGIFALAGLAMAYTGPALFLAFLAAAVPVGAALAVLAMLGSAHPVTGGTYVYGARYFSRDASFLGVWGYMLGALLGMFPLYALTGARFLQAVFPEVPVMASAIILLAIFYLANLFGVRPALRLQAVLVCIMLLAILTFIVSGTARFDSAAFRPLFSGGAAGFLVASALLTFTLLGANAAVELGDEIINPARNIPLSFMISLPVVLVLYMLMALVMAGSAPGVAKADPNLPAIAAAFMKGPVLAFFLLGGGFLAVLTTLNATYLWGTRSLIAMADDGLFPRRLAVVNRRFGTPHWLLTLVFAISVLSLLVAGDRVELFAIFASIGGILIFLPVMGAAINFKRLAPVLYAQPGFRLRGCWRIAAPLAGILLCLVTIVILLADLLSKDAGPAWLAMFGLWMLCGVAFTLLRHLMGKGRRLGDMGRRL